MRLNRKLLITISVIALLATAVLGGRYYLLARPDALPPGALADALRTALGLPTPTPAAPAPDGAPGDLRLYRVPAAAVSHPDLKDDLAALGGQLGDVLGDGTRLVRLPAAQAERAARLLRTALAPHASADRLASTLAQAASDGAKTAQVTVNIHTFASGDPAALAQDVAAAGGRVLAGLDDPDGVVLRAMLPQDGLAALAGSPRVVYIEPYTAPTLLNDRAADVIGAAPLAVPGFATVGGLTGAGETVGVADSGLDSGSLSELAPDFTNPAGVRPKVIMLKSVTGAHPADHDGHGTHIAGTIAGNGTVSGGRFRGLAPDAGLYVQSITGRQGTPQPPADLISLFRPAYEGGVRVQVNGWGASQNIYGVNASQVDRFVFWYADFLPVFGVGNDGPAAGTVTAEANAKNALVVGAATNPRPLLGPESAAAQQIGSFSSRGPAADGRIRPDLVVPGTGIISNRSHLAPDEDGGDPDYVARQGTSMAAAVAGAAAALLRQGLREDCGVESPSAALVKAALINGARPLTGDTAAEGFGHLDLAATVIALQEQSFRLTEARQGVAQGREMTYTYQVEEKATQPLCVTVAWTDPPAAPGARRALVNDLDLIVRGPDGQIWLGNDTEGQGRRDGVNNVERVRLENPPPGTYHITVRGTRITEAAAYAPQEAQDFALVYGQLPARGVLAQAQGGQAVLTDGTVLNLQGATPVVVADGHEVSARRELPSGTDLYYLGDPAQPRAVRAAYRTWQESGVRRLGDAQGADGVILASLSAELREGGRRIDPSAGPPVVNGLAADFTQLPDGAEVTAVINPSTQTLWKIEAFYYTVDGVLAAHTGPGGQLRLLDGRSYPLAVDADLTFQDQIVNGSWADLPFGAGSVHDLADLLPGMSVQLVIAPSSGKVERVVVSRRLALGALRYIPPDGGSLTLDSGVSFGLVGGATVWRDGRPATMSDLAPGDRVEAVLLPGDDRILALRAFSHVVYGQVLHVSEGRGSLYLADINGGFHKLNITEDTAVFRWGFAAGVGALSSGQWARLTLDPQAADNVARIDVAETAGEGEGRVQSYDTATMKLQLDDGRVAQLSPQARVTKDDYPVAPTDLKPGEQVRLTDLNGLPATGPVTVAVAADSDAAPPALTARGLPMLDYLFLDGRTAADRVYLYRGDGTRETLEVQGGRFVAPVHRQDGESTLRIVAVDSRTGGVGGTEVPFPAGVGTVREADDVSDHWAAAAIDQARRRGLMAGYPDGRFRPDSVINRGELTSILVRLLGLHPDPDAAPTFADAADIPAWVRPAVAEAARRGLVSGLPDGTFRADAPVTRAEATAILVAALDNMGLIPAETGDPLPTPPYTDWEQIPAWARPAVARAYATGILSGRAEARFVPDARLTRAETAAALTRITITVS